MVDFLHYENIDQSELAASIFILRDNYSEYPIQFVNAVSSTFNVFREFEIKRKTRTDDLLRSAIEKGFLNYLRAGNGLKDTKKVIIDENHMQEHLLVVTSIMLGLIIDKESTDRAFRTVVGTSNVLELCYAVVEGMKIAE
jgi:hypothetical protein